MKYIKASEFKSEFVKVVDLMAGGEALVVVKNGRPRVSLGGPKRTRKHAYFGMHRGKIQILGDIVSPMPELWE